MPVKERSSPNTPWRVESPFLDCELFIAQPEKESEARVAALVAESPFRDLIYQESRTPEIVSDAHGEETEPDQQSVDERGYGYEGQEGGALEWEDPGCAGEHASLDLEAEWFDSEIWKGSADQIAFRDRVLAAHLALSKKARGAPLPDLPDDALDFVPGTKIRTLPDTAAAAGRLLAAAHADLARAQQAGDADALRTIRVSVTSGYRGSALQRNLWLGYFSAKGGYYDRTQAARENLPEGPHSDQAAAYMLKPKRYGGFGLTGRIAAPGHSNHQGGIAIDFWQERAKGHRIENKSDETSRGPSLPS
jgi:D-alanyl-D-alanine carboxypeptidase-like protein